MTAEFCAAFVDIVGGEGGVELWFPPPPLLRLPPPQLQSRPTNITDTNRIARISPCTFSRRPQIPRLY